MNVDISKQFQSSDFGGNLSPAQLRYCANDVIYLHEIHKKLNEILHNINKFQEVVSNKEIVSKKYISLISTTS